MSQLSVSGPADPLAPPPPSPQPEPSQAAISAKKLFTSIRGALQAPPAAAIPQASAKLEELNSLTKKIAGLFSPANAQRAAAADDGGELEISVPKAIAQTMVDAAESVHSHDCGTINAARETLGHLAESLPDDLPCKDFLRENILKLADILQSAEACRKAFNEMLPVMGSRADDAKALPPNKAFAAFRWLLDDIEKSERAGELEFFPPDDAVDFEIALADPLLPEDAASCREAVEKRAAEVMKPLAEAALGDESLKPMLTDGVLRAMARASLEHGIDPQHIAQATATALVHAKTALVPGDVRSLQEIMDEITGARTPQEVSAAVDTLFMDSYPDTLDAALALKRALLPDRTQKDTVECLHTYNAARHTLLRLVFESNASSPDVRHSARTFRFTPAHAETLIGKTGMADLRYHFANVAILKAQALRSGMLDGEIPAQAADSVRSGASFAQLNDGEKQAARDRAADDLLREWGEGLGIAGYMSEVEDAQDDGNGQAVVRAVAEEARLFDKGLRGTADAEKAGAAEAKSAGGLQRLFKKQDSEFYSDNPRVLAMKALNRHLMNLTGLTDPKDLFYDDPGFVKNDQKVADAMKARFSRPGGFFRSSDAPDLKTASMFGDALHAVFPRMLDGGKALQKKAEAHVLAMRGIAAELGETIALRAEHEDLSAKLQDLEQARNSIGFAWPHQHGERLKIASTVLFIENLHRKVQELRAQPGEANRLMADQAEETIRNLLQQLEGVDGKSLLPKGTGIPRLTDVLYEMAPRARAIVYYSSGERAEDAARLKELDKELQRRNEEVRSVYENGKKFFGEDRMTFLELSVEAAVYKVFLSSGLSIEQFRLDDPNVMQQVKDQLRDWGAPVADNSFFSLFVRETCFNLTDSFGHLDINDLFFEASLEGETGILKTKLKAMGKEAAAQTQAAHEESLRSFAAADLLDYADTAGGFTCGISRGAGLAPSIGVPIPLPIPISVSVGLGLGFMRGHTLNVVKDPGGYSVVLKTQDSATISGALGLAAGVSAKADDIASVGAELVGGKAGREKTHGKTEGLFLHFSDRQRAVSFLQAFMNGAAAAPETLADEIRFVTGNSVSDSLYGAFNAVTFKAGAFYLNAGFSVVSGKKQESNTISHERQSNAHGFTDTYLTAYASKGTVTGASATAGVSSPLADGVSGSAKVAEISKGKTKTLQSSDVAVALSIAHDRNGRLSPETAYAVTVTKSDMTLEDALQSLSLPSGVRRKLESDAAFAEEISLAWLALPPGGKLTFRARINPDKLDRARILDTQYRLALRQPAGALVPVSPEEIARDHQDILSDPQSYDPVDFTFETPAARAEPGRLVLFVNIPNGAFSMDRKTVVPIPQSGPPVQDADADAAGGNDGSDAPPAGSGPLPSADGSMQDAPPPDAASGGNDGSDAPPAGSSPLPSADGSMQDAPPPDAPTLSFIPWNAAVNSGTACEATTLTWLARAKARGIDAACSLTPNECSQVQSALEHGSGTGFSQLLQPWSLDYTSWANSTVPLECSQNARNGAETALNSLGDGEYGYISLNQAHAGVGFGHAMCLYHGDGEFVFVDPNRGIWRGSDREGIASELSASLSRRPEAGLLKARLETVPFTEESLAQLRRLPEPRP